MAAGDADEYFTYEARLASFQKAAKKRGSSTSRAPKALNWPHRHTSPASLARAGFFFRPTPASVDNTVCFLCQKGLDGWEAGDDPLVEHLKHSPQCGWAVCAAIEIELGDYVREDPSKPDMIDARTATFAGRWPHDSKKGWKCKTKQLVEAGWKYTPTEDSDDMATCAYCQLALDGWEPNDKPFDEHFNRSPACPFFSLLDQYKGASKGRSRTAKARSSSQSVASEMASLTDQTTAFDDTAMTTASIVSQPAAKKSRAKKATTTRATKKKAKVEEPVDVAEDSQQADNEASLPSQPKARRGRKRRSEAVESTVASTTDGPAPKKRSGQSSRSTSDNSDAEEDDEMTDASAPKTDGVKRPQSSNQSLGQRSPEPQSISHSNAHIVSPQPTPRHFPDDDEIERQLEEDLAKQMSDADIAQDSDSERSQLKEKKQQQEEQPEKEAENTPASLGGPNSAAYALFDPRGPEPGDKSLDDELKMLQAEMEVDEPEPQHEAPKAAPRTSLRRVSKATDDGALRPESSTRAETPKPVETESHPEGHDEEKQEDDDDGDVDGDDDDGMTVGSTDTVLKKVYRGVAGSGARTRRSDVSAASAASQETIEPPVKRGRGRPSKASLASQTSMKEDGSTSPDAPPNRGRGRPSKASLASQDTTAVADTSKDLGNAPAPPKRGRGRPPKKSIEANVEEKKTDDAAQAQEARPAPEVDAPLAEPQVSPPVQSTTSLHPPSTPAHDTISPAPSARQPVLSPSHSPQSSDAENQPPLNRPPPPVSSSPSSANARRAVLAPVVAAAATPLHLSPSKRNVLAGLKSTTPWTAANIDAIFGTPHPGRIRENSVDQFLRGGRELTTPERKMTVEEWIYFNANEAEKKLKHECETLVSRFETEGTRAISVLEGLETIE